MASKEEISRRDFFRRSRVVAVGAVAGAALVPVDAAVIAATKAATGHKAGNASMLEKAEKRCADQGGCAEANHDPSFVDSFIALAVAPTAEEFAFRKAPSIVLDNLGGKDTTSSEGYGLTRREWVVGVLTSILFAGQHNLTDGGLDTHTIPTPQFVDGLVFWWLQRQFDMTANVAAHTMHNGVVLGLITANNKFSSSGGP